MNYFITGIDTDSGKTLISAILCEALQADYWKPVQAGVPRDSDTVRSLISNPALTIHPERYRLQLAASPHASAKEEGIQIQLKDFNMPATDRDLVIEGAGGCLVPLNETDFVIDLASALPCEIILVSDLYLGSINHTLLTINEIRRRNLSIKGIIFNGEPNPGSESIILQHSGLRVLLRVNREHTIDRTVVKRYANLLTTPWNG